MKKVKFVHFCVQDYTPYYPTETVSAYTVVSSQVICIYICEDVY